MKKGEFNFPYRIENVLKSTLLRKVKLACTWAPFLFCNSNILKCDKNMESKYRIINRVKKIIDQINDKRNKLDEIGVEMDFLGD